MKLLNKIRLVFILLFLFNGVIYASVNKVHSVKIDPGIAVIQGVNTKIRLTAIDSSGNRSHINCVSTVKINNEKIDFYFVDGEAEFEYAFNEKSELVIACDDTYSSRIINPVPIWLSIIPPLIAILFALIFKEVFSALFLGLFSGTFIIYFYSGASLFGAFFKGLFAIPDTYVVGALVERSHISIIIFSLLIGGTLHIITKNGGMQGLINFLAKYAKSPRSGQFVTWLLGILIFFDDYASTLVVGNTMRPISDKLRISREKLAYIVDSTGAPVAAIAFITTWIGAELSYIQSSVNDLGMQVSAYHIFFSSLKFSFYPFITLIFVAILIYMKRDFGSMYKAELRARTKGVNAADMEKKIEADLKELEVADHIKPKAFNAIIPIGIIIMGTISGLLYTGWNDAVWNNQTIGFFTKVSATIGNSDIYKSLIWASFGGILSAITLGLAQKNLNLKNSVDGMISGFKSMLSAILILTLAWSLAALISDMHTADFISQVISSSSLNPYFLPFATFVVSALISFSTGTSWGTMAIMYPLILPATWLHSIDYGLSPEQSLVIFSHVVSTVIAGSVFGDHCSPISDTTILSSLSSSCNHIQHVRTQLPYALIVGLICLVFGTLPVAVFGISLWLVYPVLIFLSWAVIRLFGKKTEPDLNIEQ